MKRKLVAALLSVAMVASVTPVSALGPVTSVEAAEADVDAFKEAVSSASLIQDTSLITSANVVDAKSQYETAANLYAAITDREEKTKVATEYNKLLAVKEQIIEVYAQMMDDEISKVAQPGKITADGKHPGDDPGYGTSFAKIEEYENILIELNDGSDTVLNKVNNYSQYIDAQAAKYVDYIVSTYYQRLLAQSHGITSDELFIKGVEAVGKFQTASEAAKAMAESYHLYTEAVARVAAEEDASELIHYYVEKLDAATTLLGKEGTQANITYAESLIEEAEAKLEKIGKETDGSYKASKKNLEDAITAAKAGLKNQDSADEFTKKVNASELTTVDLSDIAAIQEIYDLMNGGMSADALAKVNKDTLAKAKNQIAALKALIPNFDDPTKQEPNTEFTEAVIKAFPVPSASNVTLADIDAIDKANAILNRGDLLDGNVEKLLDKGSVSYANAVGAIRTAYAVYSEKQINAINAINDFMTTVNTIKTKNVSDLDYEYYLNKAKTQYEAIDAIYKEGGSSENEEVVTAYKDLKDAVKDYEKFEASKTDADIIKELVAGIDVLPAEDKLKITDKDAVYALRDKKAKLSDTGKKDFEGKYAAANNTLTKAIAAMDKLVVADLVKQISALDKVKANATLEEIQKAKAANKAVREAYDDLTDTQKAEVKNYNVLQEAEKAVADAEVQYVKDQMAIISRMDTSALTVEQAKQILAVQEIIAGMTEENANKVKGETNNYKDFQKALLAASAIIEKANNLESATVTAIPDQTYTGEDIQPTVEVKDAFGAVINPSAYKVSYKNNVDAGTATVVIASTTAGGYTGSVEAEFTIKAADISEAAVSGATKTYTGKAVTTTVKAVVGDKTLTAGTDYEVTAYESNTNVGTATVTITGKGNYTGTATGSFIVKPGKANLTKVTAGKKKATAKYTGQTGASYKVVYAVKGTTKYKAVYSKNLTKTISSLKSGTKYKVKVLAYYKDANGKAYYTGYSNMRTVKVK